MTKPFSFEEASQPAAPFSHDEAQGKDKGFASDAVNALKQGALQLPGAATGLADIPAAALGFNRPFSRAADALGDATGFKPGQWAKDAEADYSPATQVGKAQIDAAWEDPNAGALDVAKAYATNPRVTALNALQSVPAMLAGGLYGRAIGGAAGVGSSAARAAIGEGSMMAGQSMAEIDPSVDPQRAATAATAVGAGGAALGFAGGRAAQRLGITDLDTAIAGGTGGAAGKAMPIYKRVPAGMVQEGVLEEAPQSAVETLAQNWAEEKPLAERLARNVTEGALAGGLMGAVGGFVPAGQRQPSVPAAPGTDGYGRIRTEPAGGANPEETIAGSAQPEPGQPGANGGANGANPSVSMPSNIEAERTGTDGTNAAPAPAQATTVIVPNAGPLSRAAAWIAVTGGMPGADAVSVPPASPTPTVPPLEGGQAPAAPANAATSIQGVQNGQGQEEVLKPGAGGDTLAPATASFATEDEAQAYIAQQRRAGGARIQALPMPRTDGTFGIAIKGTPDYTVAEFHKRAKELRASGVLDGDILNTKTGEPFKNRLQAGKAKREAGDGHEIVQLGESRFVVRKAAPADAQASDTAPSRVISSDTAPPVPPTTVNQPQEQDRADQAPQAQPSAPQRAAQAPASPSVRPAEPAAAAPMASVPKERVQPASAPEPKDFTLTGSNRAVDVGAAMGQGDLLGNQPAAQPQPVEGPGADAGNGFKQGPKKGERYRVGVSVATGGVTLEKRLPAGTAATFYVGKDGGLVDADDVNLVGTKDREKLWIPTTPEQASQATAILDEMGRLDLADPARRAAKGRLKALVMGEPVSQPKPEPAKPTSEAVSQPETEAAPSVVRVKTLGFGDVHVRQSDLDGDRTMLPQYTADGKRKGGAIHRDNLDPDGTKLAKMNAEDSSTGVFDLIVDSDGTAFKTEAGAKRERSKRGLNDTHEVVSASEVVPGANGFVIRRSQQADTPVSQPKPEPAQPTSEAVSQPKPEGDTPKSTQKPNTSPEPVQESAKSERVEAPVSSREGQMRLANRGSRIATLKMMNDQLRRIAPDEAWADSSIEDAADLDALQDQISAALVRAQRGPEAVNPLRAELEAMSGAELRAVMERMNLAGTRMTQAERIAALLAEDPAEVRAAMVAEPPAQAPEAQSAAPTMTPAEEARRNEFLDRQRAYWDGTATPAIRNYLRAFDAFGVERMERNRIKPAGMSAREWLESFVSRQPTWDGSRKTGLTGIQALSGKDLWPTEDGSGERLRKAMLEAVKALKNAPSTTSELLAEAFMEPKPAATREAAQSAAPAEPDAQKAKAAATRTKPISTIDFSKPIVGPSGARLLSYTWQWKPMEFVDARGEERVKRISDWDASEASNDTGRDVVHQFVVDDNGTEKTVSAESAVKLLGFTAGSEGRAGFNSLSSAAKTLARLRMQEAELQQAKEQFDRDKAEVNALPLPDMPTERDGKGWFNLGDASVRQLESGPMIDERRRALIGAWRDKRMAERGWSGGMDGELLGMRLRDVTDRIKRQQAKVDKLVASAPAPQQTAITSDDQAPAGSTIVDSQGREYRVNSHRHHTIIAHPIVDGKPQVSRDTTVRFFTMQDPDLTAPGDNDRRDPVYLKEPPAPQPSAPEASEGAADKAPARAKIDDFGQKLEGARKDYATTLKDAEDVDVSAEPLSKSWPEPDYQKLLDGGADPFVVAFIHAARDEVPTKPQKSWKLKGWVDSVQTLRGAARGLLDGSISREQLDSKLTLRAFDNVRRNVGSRAELYQLVGHEKSLKGITFAEHQYTLYKGQSNVRKWVVEQKAKATMFSNWPRELAVADTKEEMLEQFRARFAEPNATGKNAPAKGKFSVYTKRKQEGVFIGKKIGREYIDLKKLPDIASARKFLDENTAELETLLEKYKETPFERNPENQPRVGDDHRNGAPVTPEVFAETFGFRGVQFGNYVEQGRRQSDLNQAFDGLMDMAAVLGIPPRAISLNGKLGLAFGARGKGGKNAPAAHYEPDNVVINLTKGEGPGSLAHEWWHAVDNYFGKNDGGAAYGTGGVLTDKTRAAMRLAFNEVKSATQQGTLRRRAMELDKRKSKAYWDTPIELSARSFESYVIAKLKDQGAANDYLANVVSKEFWDAQEALRAGFLAEGKPAETYPYPTPDEVPAVRNAFDNFFRVVETRADEAGNVAMFSRSSANPLPGISLTQFNTAMADAFGKATARRLSEAGVVVPLEDQTKLPAHVVPFLREGDRVYGFYDPRTNRTYAVLSNLTPEMVKGLTLHEVGVHYGFESMLGKDKYQQVMNRLDMMAKAGQRDVKAARAEATRNAVNESQVREETLAYLVQMAPELGIIREVIAKIKAWLFSKFSIGANSLTTADLAMLARAAVQHAARTKDGGVRMDPAWDMAFAKAEPGPYNANDSKRGGQDEPATAAEKVQRLSPIVAQALDIREPAEGQALRAVSLPEQRDLGIVGQAFGKDIVGYRVSALLGQSSPFRTIGGVSTAAIPNTIFINASNQRPHLSILGHELAHEMRRDSPELYGELIEAIRPFINQGAYRAEFTKEPVARGQTDPDAIREEFVGEVLSDGFTEPMFWNALGEKSPSLLSKVIGALGTLIDKVRRVFGPQRRTAKYLTDFDRVMKIAGEAMARYAEQPKQASGDSDSIGFARRFSSLKGNRPVASYVDATPRQKATLDAIDEGPESTDFDLLPAKEDINTSADSNFTDWEQDRGIKYVPLAMLGPFSGYDNAKDTARIRRLADAIKESNTFEPIFVGIDPNGEAYVMEGQHRVRALELLGETHVPAQVIVSMDGTEDDYSAQPDEPVQAKTDYRSAEGQGVLFARSQPFSRDQENGLPATIEVDGVQRPTTNSKGQPIHPTEEGVRNFWRWFSPSPSQLLNGLSVAEVSRLKRNTEALADFIESQSALPESDRFRVIPSSVFAHVSGVVDNAQILDAVVRSLPVDVVNFLSREQGSAKKALHNQAMLEDVFSVAGGSDISLGINPSLAANVLVRVVANAGAKISGLTDGALERNAAVLADTSDPILGDQVRISTNKDLGIINGFGESKVVDDEGRPLVVYHGTNADFSEFDPAMRGGVTGAASARMGFFFASSPKIAGYYATGTPGLDNLRRRARDAMFTPQSAALNEQLALAKSAVDDHVLGRNPVTQRMAAVRRDLARYAIDISRDMTPAQEREEWGHVKQSADDERWQLIQEYKTLREQERAAALEAGIGENGQMMAVFLSLKNPLVHDFKGSSYRDTSYADLIRLAKEEGRDGLILRNTYDSGPIKHAVRDETDVLVAFNPNQIKSATGNTGAFNPADPDIRFARGAPGDAFQPEAIKARAQDFIADLYNSPGKVNWWHKSVGTQYNLAQRSPEFKRVFDSAQSFLNDVSLYATEAADKAPSILPKLEALADIAKKPVSAQDTKAISAPIFEGTLSWVRDESGKPRRIEEVQDKAAKLTAPEKAQQMIRTRNLSDGVLKMWQGLPAPQFEQMVNTRYEATMLAPGVVWTDTELTQMFKLNPAQIKLYREFRAATDESLKTLAISDLVRFGGDDTAPVKDVAMASATVDEAAAVLRDYLLSLAASDPARNDLLIDTATRIMDKAQHADDLMRRGYAPLSRFGRYTVDVLSSDGERMYFGMFEDRMEAGKMARRMAGEFKGATVTQGTVSEEAYKLFAGVTPETLELFGDMLGLEAQGDSASSKAYQEYLKLAKSNRSAMKRLIERKGIAGYSEDAARVLAGFVYSSARQTANNLHMGEMTQAANDIPQRFGELKDAAVRLVNYIKVPQEEAAEIRGLLFAQYLGGSIASAMVNMTQPVTMTLPWLSQFGGLVQASKMMAGAVKDAGKSKIGDAKLDAALKRAEEDGTVSPQEIHQLQRQAQGKASLQAGDGTKAGDAKAIANNTLARFSLAWGKAFSWAEQFNRRTTYIAAYRTAVAQKMGDPDAFARRAIAETQGIYNKANKPQWARGAIGSTLFTFKQFSIAYVEMLHRMATRGGPEGRRAVLYSLAILFLVAGVGGMPGADDLDDVLSAALQAMGYNLDTRQKRQEFFAMYLGQGGATFLERGISGLPGSPIDVSGRLGLGNLIPGTGMLMKKTDHSHDVAEIFGPAGDLAKRTAEAAGKLAKGDIGGHSGAIATAVPKALANLFQAADMAAMGMYRDQRGSKVIDTDAVDAAFKAIGFQPSAVKLVQDATRDAQRMIEVNKLREGEIATKWAQGIFERDQEKVAAARDELREWNEDNPDSPIRIKMQQVLDRVKKMRMGKAERLEKTAPAEIKAQVRRELSLQ